MSKATKNGATVVGKLEKPPPLSPLTGIPIYFRRFYRELRWRLPAYMVLCFLAVIAESLSVVALLPLLTGGADGESAAGDSRLENFWSSLFQFLHLEQTFAALLAVVLITGLLRCLLLSSVTMMQNWLLTDLTARLNLEFVTSLSKTGYQYFAKRSHGELNYCLSTAIPGKVAALTQYVNVVSGLVFAFTYLGVAFLVDPAVALAAAAVGGVSMFFLRLPSKIAQRIGKAKQVEGGRNQALILQFLSNFKYLKATASTQTVGQKIAATIREIRRLRLRSFLVSELVNLFGLVLLLVGLVAMLYYLVEVKQQAVAGVMVVALLFYRALQSVVSMQKAWQGFGTQVAAVDVAEQAEEGLKANRELSTGKDAKPLGEGIRLENVSFAYEGEEQVLNGVSLIIEKGAFVGIAGASGAGKSTLVDLLVGLLNPTSGTIRFDGVDYGELKTESIRKQISYVVQDPVVFNDTVEANVTFWGANSKPDGMSLARACEVSCFAEVVEGLQNGYAEVLGEKGGRLSGGQRQRLSLAREIYRQTPLMILDEATASLDSRTENAVLRSVGELAGKQTLVMIAHRLIALRGCGTIIVLDKGRVVETGTWDQLTTKPNGHFRALCEAQNILREEV